MLANQGAPAVHPHSASVRELVARINASTHFRRSRRLQDFLTYICDKALIGRLEEISEQQIGHLVFGRNASYNVSEDNIVRVEARELRKRLAAYFEADGAAESITITIPKGGYVPVFEPRQQVVVPEPASVQDPASQVVPQPVLQPTQTRWFIAGLAGLCLVLAAACMYLLSRTGTTPKAPVNAETVFWNAVFTPRMESLIVVADSNLSLLQDLAQSEVTFEQYSSGAYAAELQRLRSQDAEAALRAAIASRHYTSLADVTVLVKLLGRNAADAPLRVRFARNMAISDLKGRNVILLGSRRSNPWAGVFETKLNFRIRYDLALRKPYVANVAPRANELPRYVTAEAGRNDFDAYATIALLPNLDRTGNVLLIAGTNMQGTEAAGEYLTSSEKFNELRNRLKLGTSLRHFEVLLRLKTVDGSSSSSEILAYRLY